MLAVDDDADGVFTSDTEWHARRRPRSSNPMPSRPTSVAISRTCSTFRVEGARVLVFTDKEQNTPGVIGDLRQMTLVNAAVMEGQC